MVSKQGLGMIDQVAFRKSDGSTNQIKFAQVNLVIGPNNSGKSTVLREIAHYYHYITKSVKNKTIAYISYKYDLENLVKKLIEDDMIEVLDLDKYNQWRLVSKCIRDEDDTGVDVHKSHIRIFGSAKPSCDEHQSAIILAQVIKLFTAKMFNSTRLGTLKKQPLTMLGKTQKSLLGRLYANNKMRTQWRKEHLEALGLNIVLDPRKIPNLTVGINPKEPSSEIDEIAYHAESCIDYHRSTEDILFSSDGTRAYVNLATMALASMARLILIDEPEAFLAPALEERLGVWISRLSAEQDMQVVCSTHSSYFLKGCILSGAEVRILRLSRLEDDMKVYTLEPLEVLDLFQDPMMRTSGALSALFHRGAIVCEGDTDEAFYSEINLRLVDVGRGVTDCAFLNSHTKSSISRLVGPLRKMGVPAAAIVDFDFIKQGSDLNKLLDAIGQTDIKQSLSHTRNQLATLLSDRGMDPKSIHIDELNRSERNLADQLFDTLSNYGIFIVPVGELERWDTDIEVSKSRWLEAKFKKMGHDPTKENYTQPNNEGVWNFIDKVGNWINNPGRRGML